MPRAQSADGVIHEFPEGTAPAVIDRVMKDYARAHSGVAEPPGFVAGAVHAVERRGAGLGQLVAHMGLVDPEAFSYLPAGDAEKLYTTGARQFDTGVRQFEQDYAQRRAAGGPSAATRAGEIIGGLGADIALTAPLAPLGGAAGGLVAGIVRGLGLGAAGGAITSAATPVTDTEHYARAKAEQVGVGVTVGGVVGGALGALGAAIAKDSPAEAAKVIRGSYYRGVRPGTTMTAPERGVYDARVRDAVDAIIDARGNRPLPRTPEEFSQAIAEAKSALFDHYSSMAKEAENKGARVALTPAADRLQKLAGDPLQDPAAVNEAKRLLAMIPGKVATITPTRAEEIVRYLNERATGFDTLGTKGAGATFREAGSALRSSLIDAVDKAGYPEYGALRRSYGALVSIEDDVGRATGRELSKGGPQFGLSEIGAAGLVGAGEPVSAAAIEGGKRLTSWLKSPNRAITKLFSEAASLRRAPSASARAGAALPPAIPAMGGAAAGPPAALVGLRDRIAAQRQGATQPVNEEPGR